MHLPYILPKYMSLGIPCDIMQRRTLQTSCHTKGGILRVELVTWTYNTSRIFDLCNANDVQDEQHVSFFCTHPHVDSLHRTCKVTRMRPQSSSSTVGLL